MLHRNSTAQWLDQYTGSEFWSDIIDGAIGIILTLGAKAPATVGSHVFREIAEQGVRKGVRQVGKELTEAGITRAGPAAKFLEKQAARRALESTAKLADDVVANAPKGRAFTVDPRVVRQLSDSRLGSLAGKITPKRLHELVNNNSARRFFDTRTGNINVIQEIEGKLVRITVAGDKFKIISVGPIRERNIFNLIMNGGFVP